MVSKTVTGRILEKFGFVRVFHCFVLISVNIFQINATKNNKNNWNVDQNKQKRVQIQIFPIFCQWLPRRLSSGSIFSLCNVLSNLAHLLHKLGLSRFVSLNTIYIQWCSFETRQVIIISLGVLTSGVYYFGVRIILTLKPLMH